MGVKLEWISRYIAKDKKGNFYFCTPYYDLEGPFKTQEEAVKAFEKYKP